MIGKLPTLSSSRALVSTIFLFYDASRVVSQFAIEDDFEYDSPTSPQKNSRKEVIFFKYYTFVLLVFYYLFKCCHNRIR